VTLAHAKVVELFGLGRRMMAASSFIVEKGTHRTVTAGRASGAFSIGLYAAGLIRKIFVSAL
jgi:hypothetical protein